METHFAEQTEKEKNLLKAHHEELTNIEFKHKNYQLPNLSKHTFSGGTNLTQPLHFSRFTVNFINANQNT